MLGVFLRKARRSAKDESGIALVLFLLLIVPILLLVGVAVDMGQFLVMKRQIQAAADASALKAATDPIASSNTSAATPASPFCPTSSSDAALDSNAFVSANYNQATAIGTLQSTSICFVYPTVVQVTASATLDTAFLRFAGYSQLSVAVSAQAARKNLEVAIIVDNTDAMVANPQLDIQTVKQELGTLVSNLFTGNSTSSYVKIGVVPFAAAVNVGNTSPPSWVDQQGLSPLNTEDINAPAGLYSLYGSLQGAIWQGCVRQRPEPYDIQETQVLDVTNPSLVFVPYFAPSEVWNSANPSDANFIYTNAYIDSDNTGTGLASLIAQYYNAAPGSPQQQAALQALQTYQKDPQKYINGKVDGYNPYAYFGGSPGINCPVAPIWPLTSTSTDVTGAIDGMKPPQNPGYSLTLDPLSTRVFPAGLMWGWHVLSPYPPFSMGAPYGDGATQKVIIFVTAGPNSVGSGLNGVLNWNFYNAYGYFSDGHLGDQSYYYTGGPEVYLNTRTATLCNNIKANAIAIYTIALTQDTATTNLLQTCASDSTKYFAVQSPGDLTAAITAITLQLGRLNAVALLK